MKSLISSIQILKISIGNGERVGAVWAGVGARGGDARLWEELDIAYRQRKRKDLAVS